jgi:hypothetical protein
MREDTHKGVGDWRLKYAEDMIVPSLVGGH